MTAAANHPSGERTWELDIPILTHPLMVKGVIKIFALATLLMWALLAFLFAVQGEWDEIADITIFTGAIGGGVFALSLLVSVIVLRNRIRMRFIIDGEGATTVMLDSRVRFTQKLAIIGGVLGGSPGAVGSGLIGQSRNVEHTAWSAIARVDYHPRWNAISLRNEWRTIMILFCPPQAYAAIATQVAAAMAKPERVNRVRRANPIPKLLLLTVVTIVACIPLFVLPHVIGGDLLAALLVLAFALTSIWLIPIFMWVVYAVLAWIVVAAVAKGEVPYHSQIGNGTFPHWQLMDGDDWAMVTFAGLGILWLIWLGRLLLTGKVESALAGDEARMAGMEDDETAPKD